MQAIAVIVGYLCFLPIAALCFARLPLRPAILLVLIGGWWLLPVGRYGPAAPGTIVPWWITGTVLPSDMLLTKGWIAPLVAFAGAAFRDHQALRSWRPALIDLPMAGWCLWPLVDSVGVAADPPAWLASLYIIGVWGLPWLLGRVWFAAPDAQLALVRALALSGLANVPVAMVEGVRPAVLYGILYGPHPYQLDGIKRYVGYRPIGFLEHGNLYGLWAALAAFAGVSLLPHMRGTHRGRWTLLAIINVAVALAAQSAGAIILLVLGLALLAMCRLRAFLPLLAGAMVLLLLVAAVYVSGFVPLQSMARSSAGQYAIASMRAIGRGSLSWRVSQDTKTLASIAAHPIVGAARWDWWRPYGTRPWGQALLLLGQYGLIGLLLAWGALLAACLPVFVRARKWSDRTISDPALPLAITVLLALADATLNAFFFSLAIIAAGAISASPMRRPEPRRPAISANRMKDPFSA